MKEKSPRVQVEKLKLDAAEWKSTLSKWEFAPDIHLQYQKRLSGQPSDSEIYSVGFTFPLWFWSKGAKASAASSRRASQEFRLRSELERQIARVKDLVGKVETGKKTLKIYKTSLIPQAEGAYSSSRASYRASKSSFLDLLDSERSLFRVKTGYYQALQMYAAQVVRLEAELGYSISNIENKVRGRK